MAKKYKKKPAAQRKPAETAGGRGKQRTKQRVKQQAAVPVK